MGGAMKRFFSFIFLIVLLTPFRADSKDELRGGSDGPTPFTRITPPKKVVIPLRNPFSSFVYLNEKQTVAYTDAQKRLVFHNLATGEDFALGSFQGKIFPVIDPTGKALLSDNLRDIKVIKSFLSFKDLRLPVSKQFGFWSDGKLWMIKSFKPVAEKKWQLSFFSYQTDKNQVVHRQCLVKLVGADRHVELSNHHTAPFFSLYSYDSKREPTTISTFLINPVVENGICPVERHVTWKERFDGGIQSVNLAQKNRELVVLTDGVIENLYYSSQKKIFSTKLAEGNPWLLNPNFSVLVNLTAKKGIDIYSLETEKYFTINIIADRLLLADKQIWVDPSGDYLFISAPLRSGKTNERVLYMMSLKKLNE